MADKRTYEIVFIVDPGADDAEVMKLSEAVQKIITDQGGTITKIDMMTTRRKAVTSCLRWKVRAPRLPSSSAACA